MERNQAYSLNYAERATAHQTSTSQVAESPMDAFINARHKKTGTMQWSRDGADNVLQIRATMASKAWARKWQSTVLSALGAPAEWSEFTIYITLPGCNGIQVRKRRKAVKFVFIIRN